MNASKFFRSFSYALRGIGTVFNEEFNARVHLLAAMVAIVLGIVLKVAWFEWIILVLVMGGVFAMELINTSIEHLADLYSRELNPKIKKIKDLAAGAVLVASITALVIGLIIFLPKIMGQLHFVPR
ncbi:MAG: diacylglycerol kinase family protein [Bacteroidetes bacterium]|nr:MAG: diacylglycerol kinase family protein [Bacteroidota bacterium]